MHTNRVRNLENNLKTYITEDKERRVLLVLRSKHVNEELNDLELVLAKGTQNETTMLRALLKSSIILIKLIRDIRSNQVTVMKQQGIKMVKSQPKQEG